MQTSSFVVGHLEDFVSRRLSHHDHERKYIIYIRVPIRLRKRTGLSRPHCPGPLALSHDGWQGVPGAPAHCDSAPGAAALSLPGGMYELGTEHGSDIFRTFLFHWKHTVLVLTNGYQKKSLKMDTHEFERAQRYREDWLQRSGGT